MPKESPTTDPPPSRPVLLCFDGSDGAASAIASAGRLLGPQPAVLITVCEPTRLWSPADPATILDAPIGKVFSKALGLEEIADAVARNQADRGLELARAAGFRAQGSVKHGKAWRVICGAADELDAAVIVLGARGLTRVQSVLLGSVSAAVSAHAKRPVLIIHEPTTTAKPKDAGQSAPTAIAADPTQ